MSKAEYWLEDCKKRYSKDTIKEALAEGRVAIRTFPINATEDFNLNKKSRTGGQGLLAFSEKLNNPSLHPQASSFSILPTKLFLSERGRIGILTTLPLQEDVKEYQKLIKEDIDPSLKKEIKQYFTRPTYFDKEDMLSKHERTAEKHYRPDFEHTDKETLKSQASKYQSFAKNPDFHNLKNHNEALVKVRESSKLCLVAFNKKDLKYILENNLKETLPNSEETECALIEPETNIIKFVDEKHYRKTGEIEFTHEVNAFECQPKSLALKTRMENFLKR